jgi:hypothetical protein
MKITSWKTVLFVVTVTSLLLSACSFSINLGDTTPTAQPPTIEVTPVTGQETKPTESTSTTGTSTYTLSTTQFVIPSQAFSLYPPEGWENQSKDREIKVEYISPDGSVVITTQFTNTGYTLDKTAFENYINGTQENFYSSETNYAEQSRELHLDQGYGMVYVTFDFNNVPQKAERLYLQDGNVIFETEIWTDADKWDQNVDFFNQYLAGIKYTASNVKDYEPYMFVRKYTGPNDLFSFEYLTPWKYNLNSDPNDKTFYSESFVSPDVFASIDVWYYNDKSTYWSQGDAGQWAIDNLESVYAKGTGDLKIDSDQINDNGYEELKWHTLKNNFVGITVFKAKDTEIMLLTTYWQKDYSDVYQSSMEYTITTFASPAK